MFSIHFCLHGVPKYVAAALAFQFDCAGHYRRRVEGGIKRRPWLLYQLKFALIITLFNFLLFVFGQQTLIPYPLLFFFPCVVVFYSVSVYLFFLELRNIFYIYPLLCNGIFILDSFPVLDHTFLNLLELVGPFLNYLSCKFCSRRREQSDTPVINS